MRKFLERGGPFLNKFFSGVTVPIANITYSHTLKFVEGI
jgi:hypothetical protein